MRLADFIEQNKSSILIQWDAFAASQLPAATGMTARALRDHIDSILDAIIADLSTAQSPEEQAEKAQGLAPADRNAARTAAETHGLLRAEDAFDINQLVGEFRALRASVLRLWQDRCHPAPVNMDDVIRFNEAIDQAVAESVAYFNRKTEEGRYLFLGMLGHDLRTPLQAIQLTALFLKRVNSGNEISAAAVRLINSSARMQRMLADLVAFNRTTLGFGILLSRASVDLADAFGDEIDELRRAYPDARIEMDIAGQTVGAWDAPNLQRLLGNLVENGVKYGDPGDGVEVVVRGSDHDVRLEVRNSASGLDNETISSLFDPLKRGAGSREDKSSLGLGLYIARKIAEAHGGEVNGTASEGRVVFSVSIPRSAAPFAA